MAAHNGGNGSDHDVINFLKDQHREVKRLFSEIASGTGSGREEPFQCLVRMLAVHETAEELVVHPKARTVVPDGDAKVDARLDEENKAKKMLADLEKGGVEAPDFDEKFEEFRLAVLAHAEAEEKELFEPMRDRLEPQERSRLAAVVQTAEKMAPTHPHPHGPESSVGNLLVGPFVAIADRVRDAFAELRERAER
jgi:hemerythrin superfamily protein